MSHFRKEKRKFFDLGKDPFGEGINEPYVIKAISEKLATFNDGILFKIAETRGWVDFDMAMLAPYRSTNK